MRLVPFSSMIPSLRCRTFGWLETLWPLFDPSPFAAWGRVVSVVASVSKLVCMFCGLQIIDESYGRRYSIHSLHIMFLGPQQLLFCWQKPFDLTPEPSVNNWKLCKTPAGNRFDFQPEGNATNLLIVNLLYEWLLAIGSTFGSRRQP